MKRKIFTLLVALCSVVAIQAQRYVTEQGAGNKTGIGGWENASKDIQRMIDELAEEGGGEVWVAQGIYTPTKKIAEIDEAGNPTTIRDQSFRLRKNVSLYGGFDGTETSITARDWETNVTVLSGSVNVDESAYHVVVGIGEDDMGNAEFDGFTVTGGRALHTEADPAAKMEEAEHPFKKAISIQGKENGIEKEYRLPRESGAGVYIFGCSNFTMNNLKIAGNIGTQDVGLRIRACVGDITFSNSIIYNNRALIGGNAGGFCNGSAVRKTPLSLLNVIVQHNENIRDVTFTINYSIANIKDLTIENNISAEGGSYVSCFIGYSEVDIENLCVKNNISPIGVNLVFEKITNSYFTDVYVLDNKIEGAAGSGGILMNNLENVTIKGLFVKGHHRTTNNSGVYLVNSNAVTIEDFKIEENETEQKFGGIHVHNAKDVVLKNGEIKKNHSSGDGGGISLSNSNVTAVNLLITDNTSTTGNSAIFMDKNSSLGLINSTIAHNNTQSNIATGGIDYNDRNTTLNNSIVWGNENGTGLSNITGTIPSATTHNLIQGFDLTSSNGLDGETVITDPTTIFVDYAGSDYRLIKDSPVIDKGDNNFLGDIFFDLDGRSRVLHGGFADQVDLGAYEYEADEIPVFYGGIMNNAGQHVFTYSGSEIALKVVNILDGTGVVYSWENKEISESGAGLPVNAGTYTVVATIGGFSDPVTAEVFIQKRYLPISILDDRGLVLLDYSWNTSVGGGGNLSADYDTDIAGSLNITFKSLKPEVVSVTTTGEATAIGTGGAVIRTVTEEGNTGFHRNYDVSEALSIFRVTLIIDGDVPAGTVFEEEVIIRGNIVVSDPGGEEVIFGDNVTTESGSNITFNGDIIFKEEITFNGGSEFNGNVTFEKGANFPNEVPVFNGDATISGDITLPVGGDGKLVIDNRSNNDNTITIDGTATINNDMEISGGTLKIGNLTVEGDLTLNEVTLDVEQGASIDADNLIVNTPPKSTIDLTELEQGINVALTLTGVTGDPNDLFDITVLGGHPAGQGVTFEWKESSPGSGNWTLETTANHPIPNTSQNPDPVLYTVSYDAGEWGNIKVAYNGFEITSGSYVDAGTSVTISATPTMAGMYLKSLTVNGEPVENNSSITINGDTDIIAVFELEGSDPNPDPTDNVNIGGKHLWTSDGYLSIQTNQPVNVYVVSMAGRMITNQNVPAGETSILLEKGIYMVKVDNNVTKIIVR